MIGHTSTSRVRAAIWWQWYRLVWSLAGRLDAYADDLDKQRRRMREAEKAARDA